jgi:hypothetical protein
MTLGHYRVLGWNKRREKLEHLDEPIGVKIDFECSLHLEFLRRVCIVGVGGKTLGIAPSKESLDKLLDYPGFLALWNGTGGLDTR